MVHYLKLVGNTLIIISLFVLSGCGQKGDLYLPNIPPAPLVSDDSIIDSENKEDKQKEASLLESPMTSEAEQRP